MYLSGTNIHGAVIQTILMQTYSAICAINRNIQSHEFNLTVSFLLIKSASAFLRREVTTEYQMDLLSRLAALKFIKFIFYFRYTMQISELSRYFSCIHTTTSTLNSPSSNGHSFDIHPLPLLRHFGCSNGPKLWKTYLARPNCRAPHELHSRDSRYM